MTRTWMSRTLLFSVVLFISSALQAGEKTQPFAEIMPDGTIMCAEVSSLNQWSKDFDQTALAHIMGEPEIRQFLAGPFAHISFILKKAAEARQQEQGAQPQPAPQPAEGQAGPNAFSTLLRGLNELAHGPFGVAVRFSPEDAQMNRQPAVLVMVGLGDSKDIEATNNTAANLLEKLLKDWKVEALTINDYQNSKLISITVEDKGQRRNLVTLTLHKGRLFVSNDQKFCTQAIDGMAGTLAKKLSDSEAYKNCGLRGDEHLVAFLDVAGLQKALGAVPRPDPAAINQMDDFFVLAGLNKAIAVAWSLRMNGPAFESRTAIFTEGERAGLLGTLDTEALSTEALKFCPKETPIAAGFRLRQDRVLPFLRNAIKAMRGPQGLEDFNAVEKQLNTEFGKDLDKELQAAFGNELVVASYANFDSSGPVGAAAAFGASLSIKDAKRADELLGQILTRIAAKNDPAGLASNVLREVDHGGTKLRYLLLPKIGGFVELAPAFAIHENRLLMAMDVQTLKRSLRVVKEGPSLLDSEQYKKGLSEVGGKLGPMFSYVDWGFMYRSAFNFTTSTIKLIAPTDILREIGIDLNLLPSTDTVTRHLFPGVSIAQIAPNGVTMISRSPLPSLEVLSPPLAAVSSVFASFRPFVIPEKK